MIITKFNKYRQEPEVNVRYFNNGQKDYEAYYLNGKRHREDGPAYQSWYENGKKQFEEYYLNSKYHREDDPAYQWWYENGQKRSEFYYLNRQKYSMEKWIEKFIKNKNLFMMLKNIIYK